MLGIGGGVPGPPQAMIPARTATSMINHTPRLIKSRRMPMSLPKRPPANQTIQKGKGKKEKGFAGTLTNYLRLPGDGINFEAERR
jgi:hypothetical protein